MGASQQEATRARVAAYVVAERVKNLARDYRGDDLAEYRSWLLACSAAIRYFADHYVADQARPETRGAHRWPVDEQPAPSVRRMRHNRGWQS